MFKKVINPSSYNEGWEHHYAIHIERDYSYRTEMVNWACFGKLKTNGIKEAILVSKKTEGYKDVILNYFRNTNKGVMLKRDKLFKEVFKEIPSLNVFKGKVFTLNGMSCIKLNLDIPGPNLAKGLFFFRGVNRLKTPDFNTIKNYSLEDKIIYTYLANSNSYRVFNRYDSQPWEGYMNKEDIIRFIKGVHKGSFIEDLNFNLIETSKRYRNRRVEYIELPDRLVRYE